MKLKAAKDQLNTKWPRLVELVKKNQDCIVLTHGCVFWKLSEMFPGHRYIEYNMWNIFYYEKNKKKDTENDDNEGVQCLDFSDSIQKRQYIVPKLDFPNL